MTQYDMQCMLVLVTVNNYIVIVFIAVDNSSIFISHTISFLLPMYIANVVEITQCNLYVYPWVPLLVTVQIHKLHTSNQEFHAFFNLQRRHFIQKVEK